MFIVIYDVPGESGVYPEYFESHEQAETFLLEMGYEKVNREYEKKDWEDEGYHPKSLPWIVWINELMPYAEGDKGE